MIKPQSISEIYGEVFTKWFRVRDITTLRDYLVVNFCQWDMGCRPIWASVMCCDDAINGTVSCSDEKYILLSSSEELSHMRTYTKTPLCKVVLESYKAAARQSAVQANLKKPTIQQQRMFELLGS